jgi:hypothetical protein
VWSQYGFGWRDDPNVADGDPRRLLTFKVDQATIEAKVLKAALLVDQLMDLQDRCNRLQVERSYKKMYESI